MAEGFAQPQAQLTASAFVLNYVMNYLLSLSVASDCQGFNDLMHNVSKHIHRCRLDTGLNGRMLNGLKDFT